MKKLTYFITLLTVMTFFGCNINTADGNQEGTGPDLSKMTTITKLQKLIAEKATKSASENNPVAIHKLTADPCILVYNDTVYLYGSNDAQQAENTSGNTDNSYNYINTLNVFKSKDLVNWTDCGEIPVAGKNNSTGAAKWASNSWAPAVAYKKIDGKDKFFIYFADNGSGIGVVSSDSPTGPFVDPLGKQLISRSTPNVSGAQVPWLFDPAVFIDDDGKGYLYFGGGHSSNNAAHPKSARCVQLGDDMISIVGTPVEIDAPWLFEDSGINKINGKYVYSYCSNWADKTGATGDVPPSANIAYMTSDSPLGPFKYQGYFLQAPGAYWGWDKNGNNHHWIFQFNNKWYIAFHAQTTEKKIGFTKSGYRSIFMDELRINSDGSIPVQTTSDINYSGVNQVTNFSPYDIIPAATMHSSSKIAVTSNQTVVPIANNSWILLKNVNFTKDNSTITVKTKKNNEGSITFMVDNPSSGKKIATIDVTGETNTLKVELPAGTKGVHNLYLVFTGSVELVNWSFN